MEEKLATREINNKVYIGVLRELIAQGKEVPLVVRGSSMAPFLVDHRDKVLISPIEKPLKRGDMAIFQRNNGQYIMHRIRYARSGKTAFAGQPKDAKASNHKHYYFIGDAQRVTEGPIERDQIFGVITAVCRKGKWLRKGSFWWEFFAHVWLAVIPARRGIQTCYGMAARIVGHLVKKS